MGRELWPLLYHELRETANDFRQKYVQIPGRVLVAETSAEKPPTIEDVREGLELPPVGPTAAVAGDPVALAFETARAACHDARKKARAEIRTQFLAKSKEIDEGKPDPRVLQAFNADAEKGTAEAEVLDPATRKPIRPDTPVWKGSLTPHKEAGHAIRMDSGRTFLVAEDDQPTLCVWRRAGKPQRLAPPVDARLRARRLD